MKSVNLGKSAVAVIVLLLLFFDIRIFFSLILSLFSITHPKNQILVVLTFLNRVIVVIKLLLFSWPCSQLKCLPALPGPRNVFARTFILWRDQLWRVPNKSSISVMKIHAVVESLILILSFNVYIYVFQEKSASSNARLKTNKEIPGLVHQPRAK